MRFLLAQLQPDGWFVSMCVMTLGSSLREHVKAWEVVYQQNVSQRKSLQFLAGHIDWNETFILSRNTFFFFFYLRLFWQAAHNEARNSVYIICCSCLQHHVKVKRSTSKLRDRPLTKSVVRLSPLGISDIPNSITSDRLHSQTDTIKLTPQENIKQVLMWSQ